MNKIAFVGCFLVAVLALSSMCAAEDAAPAYKVTVPAPDFVPTKVWDDGKFTYIELPKHMAGGLPVVFALSEEGERELVNFEWDDKNSRIIVSRLLDKAILVRGDKTVVIRHS